MQSRRRFTQTLVAGIPAGLAYGAIIQNLTASRSAPRVTVFATFRRPDSSRLREMPVGRSGIDVQPCGSPCGGSVGTRSGGGGDPAQVACVGFFGQIQSRSKQFDAAGVNIELLCYNLGTTATDDEIDYSFQMAKALSAKAISSSTKVSVAKRGGAVCR